MEHLEGRQARCYCGKLEPSSNHKLLAFFEYRGDGSPNAYMQCKHCGYYEVAHHKHLPKSPCQCVTFEPHGAYEYDSFYCGCRGFD